jgi:RNA polymerase sigma factor (sigma-70 family)
MTRVASKSVVRQLGSLFERGSLAGLSDRELLERFNDKRRGPDGEAAFAALVGRHGPMVLGVCRQLLGDWQHAEDAFQAVFFVLAQRAGSIQDPDLLGNWLYGVATRTARCANQQIVCRRKREERDTMSGSGAGLGVAAEATSPPADQAVIDREAAEAIHAEVGRLPRAFRLPVVLCYFEGLTLDQAARRLRCPPGTLRSRLARAREKLRLGLTRRGVALPAAALAAVLTPRNSSASFPPILCEATTRAATAFAARHAASGTLSASAATLAQEVLRTMLIHKLKLIAMAVALCTAVSTGAGLATRSLDMNEDAMKDKDPMRAATAVGRAPQDAAQAPAAGRGSRDDVGRGSPDPARTADRRSPEQAPARTHPRAPRSYSQPAGRMNVAGRVLDAAGKPVPGAEVEVFESARTPWVGASEEIEPYSVSTQGKSDGEGRFRVDAARTSSTRVRELGVLAAAPGYGLGWTRLNPDAAEPAADIKLPPEHTVRLRLIDVYGAPARKVEVSVLYLSQLDRKGRPSWIHLGQSHSATTRSWPGPFITDDHGRIAIKGLGRGVTFALGVTDIRYARQELYIEPESSAAGTEMILALEPARVIEGRVLAADTGQPIPNAIVSATSRVHNEHASGFFTAKIRADAEGRFKINPIAGKDYTIGAFPTGGEPYLVLQEKANLTPAQMKATRDIKLPRGVLIRGKVTEQGTGRPLAASSIQYVPDGADASVLSGWQAIVPSEDDGSFRIAVAPGKGHLLIFGPTGQFVLDEPGSKRLNGEGQGWSRTQAHAIIPYEVKAGDPPHEVAVALRPSVTIKGRVEGPDGQTIDEASIITTLYIEAFNPFWRGDFQIPVRDGRFQVNGLASEGTARIYVLDSEHEWGATVDIAGTQAGEDMAIRLQPCGKAVARFVGPDGKPVARYQPYIELVAASGPSASSPSKMAELALTADARMVDRKHFPIMVRADAEGRFPMNGLIPGATYRISDRTAARGANTRTASCKEFTAKAGETLYLGDIVIQNPDT